MSELDLDAVRERASAATLEIWGLCDGTRKWTMSVPVREDHDSDTVIVASLSDIDTLLAEVAKVTAERDRLRTAWTSARHRAVDARESRDMEALFAKEFGQDVVQLRREVKTLTADRDKAHEESARAYSQGVEDMREAATRAASDAPGTPRTPAESIRDVTLTGPATDPHGGEEVCPGSIRAAEDALEAYLDSQPADPESCTSRSTFGPGDTRTCELPAGHQEFHRDRDGTWTDDGADKEPAPEPGSSQRHPLTAFHDEPAPRDSDLARVLREQMKRYGPPAVAAEVARLIQQRL